MGSDVVPSPMPLGVDINADRGQHVVAASIVLLVLPTVAVCLRLCSRWMARAGFWVHCETPLKNPTSVADGLQSGTIMP